MAFSEMSSRERTIIGVLAGIIVIALIGIGVLVAKLAAGGGSNQPAGGITGPAATLAEISTPPVTVTLVANPSLDQIVEEAAAPVSEQPVAVARAESPGALLPVIVPNQALQGDHRYRIEIEAEDGSSVLIRGSWSQSAKSASGELALPLPESIEATTPFRLEVVPPMNNPSEWRITVSAAPKDLLAQPPHLAITIWDVTGSQ
jgi:hypothetical protein